MIDQMLSFNKEFVESEGYKPFITSKYPDKKIAILTCMDTRLSVLLPAALGIKNGDVKIIKNAGGVISDNFGESMRSILIGIYELGVEEVMVIAHTDCGVQHLTGEAMRREMLKRGITQETLDEVEYCGIDIDNWFAGFGDTAKSVHRNMEKLRNHPFMPKDISIRGFIIDSTTGELTEVK